MKKIALVTGGTGGIGKEVARGLLQRGMAVMIVGRTAAKGEQTAAKLGQSTGNKHVSFVQADLSQMREVQRVAETFRAQHDRLDVLVHSAGIIHMRFDRTDEGIEYNIASSFLQRFLLTNLLLDQLKAGAPSRVVNIAGSRGKGKIDLSHFSNPSYGGMRAHGQAQAANDAWTVELAKRLSGTGVQVVALNPGAVDTDIRREMPNWMTGVMKLIFGRKALTPAQGAELPLWLATEADEIHGKLYSVPRKELMVTDELRQVGSQLWDASAQATESPFR